MGVRFIILIISISGMRDELNDLLGTGLSRSLRERGVRVAILTRNEQTTTLSVRLSNGTRAVMTYVDEVTTIQKLVLEIDPSVSCILCVGWNQRDTSSVWIGPSETSSSNSVHDLTIDSIDLDSYPKLEPWLDFSLARVLKAFYFKELTPKSRVDRIWRFIARPFKSRAVR
ncbi:MAG: hypothetical protein VYD09_00235 [Chloroflexota bacterium]|nr:hypothetical protein [Chloroflexota bacterium]